MEGREGKGKKGDWGRRERKGGASNSMHSPARIVPTSITKDEAHKNITQTPISSWMRFADFRLILILTKSSPN